MIAVVVLACLTALWLGVALAPAIRELRRPRDDQALAVDMYEADVRSFASGFRRYMEAQLPRMEIVRRLHGGHEGRLPDGTVVLKLLEQASPLLMHGEGLDDEESSERMTQKLVVSYARLVLPRGLASVGGLYATEFVCGGEAGVFRALLGERDVMLARNSVVLRWVHSDANLTVETGSVLHGRASANGRLQLAPGTQFERLYGLPVLFGEPHDALALMPERRGAEFRPDNVLDASPSRTIVDGDVVIPPGSQVRANLVVRGSLLVGPGCEVVGSVKSHGALTIAAHATIAGSVVSASDIDLREGAVVRGAVIAERDVAIGPGVVIGTHSVPATVTAENVRVQAGAVVFGTVWTKGIGAVTEASSMSPGLLSQRS